MKSQTMLLEEVETMLGEVEQRMLQQHCTKEVRELAPDLRKLAAERADPMGSMIEQKISAIEVLAERIEKQQAKTREQEATYLSMAPKLAAIVGQGEVNEVQKLFSKIGRPKRPSRADRELQALLDEQTGPDGIVYGHRD